MDYDWENLSRVLRQVDEEVCEAIEAFPPMNTAHEGWAIIKEELDELWEDVRRKNDGSDQGRDVDMRKEAIQVAAMAVRFILDVCDESYRDAVDRAMYGSFDEEV